MKKLKRYIIQCVGITIVGAICAFVFHVHNQQKYYFPLFIVLIFVELFYMYRIYTYSYLPGLKLQAMLDEYRRMNDMEEVRRLGREDLLQEIKEMLFMLEGNTLQQKNAEILMKNAEINNLQDQINLHFLYNTLEVIRGEALVNGDRKIAEMTASLANYFRYNISRKETFVHLKDELKNSMNYFNIQKNRFGDKIACEILYHDVEEGVVGNCYIPKLILQPVIENAIYHGLELKLGSGVIEVHISVTDDSLLIMVSDDGLGMEKEKLDELNSDCDMEDEDGSDRHNGVALKNIKKRLKLYWGKKAYIIVTSEVGIGTQIHMCMPLLYQKEEYMK